MPSSGALPGSRLGAEHGLELDEYRNQPGNCSVSVIARVLTVPARMPSRRRKRTIPDMLAQSWAVLAGASSASAASVDEFYKVFAANAFTLLGLWLAVVQLRFKEGAGAPVRRRHAYATAMFFVLPGVMSLAATIDPDQPLLWRIAFSGVGALGILEILLYVTGGIPHSRGATWLRVLGALVYLLIVVVALLPDVAAALDLGARQVEAVLLGVVLVIGVHLFWFGVTTPNPDAEIE